MLAKFSVLAVFMLRCRRLPGELALRESLVLAKRIAERCESFVNPTTLIESSELSLLARVRTIIDVSPAYADGRDVLRVEDREHSFLTPLEATALLEQLPAGTVGILVDETQVTAFLGNESSYDRIDADNCGKWSVTIRCSSAHLMATFLSNAELIIFESA